MERISTAAGVLQKNEEAALANRELFAAGLERVANVEIGKARAQPTAHNDFALAGDEPASVHQFDLRTQGHAHR